MQLLLERAIEVSGKRFRPSSVAVYRSVWKRLVSELGHLDKDYAVLVTPAQLRQALLRCGSYASGKKALGLFRWVSETLATEGLHLGEAYREVEQEYWADERPEHHVERFEKAAPALAEAALTSAKDWKGLRLAAIVRLLSDTGLRREELLGLRRSFLTLSTQGGYVDAGKGVRKRRLPVSLLTQEALEAWYGACPWPNSTLVFPGGPDDKKMDASTLWRQLRRAEEVAGPADKTLTGPTGYRAGVARRLKEQGASVADIQKALGHRLASSTEDLLKRV